MAGCLAGQGRASAQSASASGIRNAVPLHATAARLQWSFGRPAPHVRDAARRTALGLGFGAIFMGFGLGIDRLNHAQCTGNAACFAGNPVQTGMSFAFLGSLAGASAPQFASKCTRSGRAILGIIGAVAGASIVASAADVRLFSARSTDPATFRTMGFGLLGISAGAGIVTAIC